MYYFFVPGNALSIEWYSLFGLYASQNGLLLANNLDYSNNRISNWASDDNVGGKCLELIDKVMVDNIVVVGLRR